MERRALLGFAPLLAGVAATAVASPAAASGGGGSSSGNSFLGLPTVTGNVRRPGGGLGVMTVEVGVDRGEEVEHKSKSKSLVTASTRETQD